MRPLRGLLMLNGCGQALWRLQHKVDGDEDKPVTLKEMVSMAKKEFSCTSSSAQKHSQASSDSSAGLPVPVPKRVLTKTASALLCRDARRVLCNQPAALNSKIERPPLCLAAAPSHSISLREALVCFTQAPE